MAAPAGWYVDPQNPQLMRFFDGQSWTAQTQPVQAAAPQSPTTAAQQGPSVSYEHPGRKSAAQQPGEPGQPGSAQGQQPGFGQPGFGQPGYPSAGAGQANQQPGAGFAGYGQPGVGQPANAQQPAGDRPKGTPRGVKFAIAGAAVGVLAITGIGMALSDDGVADDVENGLTAAELGLPPDFDCQMLADEAMDLSSTDPIETQLVSVTDLSESKNRIGHVLVPEGDKDAVLMECSGDATWGDGNDTSLKLRLTLNSDGELYVEYSDR